MTSEAAGNPAAGDLAGPPADHAEPLMRALLLAGLAVLYGPTLAGLFRGIWGSEEQAHGPIVLAVSLWLLYRARAALAAEGPPSRRSVRAGWTALLVALLFHVVGRSQDILIFEIGSLIGVLAALVMMFAGAPALKKLWFPLFFMVFMIPLPSVVVDSVTLPMKIAVSNVVEQVLYRAGYPIARSGVILHLGGYQLFVADACAGLHTLFSLEAMGLLYLNLVRHASVLRNVLLAALIVPISFTANVIRVIVLSLVTFHLGDAAGRGFLHDFAGLVLFTSALLLIALTDSLLRVVRKPAAGVRP
ncbi:MAG TPA: exosortase B [Burkholderiaceae bacterium]|nr:exosortase B [Burkholderiaceae bacterium]